MDIGFLLDGSGSVGEYGFRRIQSFVNQVVDNFHISKEMAQIGVIEFSNNAVIKIRLNDFQDRKELKGTILNITDSGGRTRTDRGIHLASREFFTSNNGARPGVPKLLILVTDGTSTGDEPLKEAVKGLLKKGVVIYVVGIGGQINDQELKDVTPSDSNIFKTKNFDTITLVTPSLVEKILGDLKGRFVFFYFACTHLPHFFLLSRLPFFASMYLLV